jgi:hypothetical protein
MAQQANVDGVLIQWGDRLFYPRNRIVPRHRRDGSGAVFPARSGEFAIRRGEKS